MDQATRDRKIGDLIAHKSPDELAGMVVDAQAAQDEARDKADRDKPAEPKLEADKPPPRLNQPIVKDQPFGTDTGSEEEPHGEHAKRSKAHSSK